MSTKNADLDKKLRADVKNLGMMLGDAIITENENVFQSVEKLRKLGRDWRTADRNALQEMVDDVKTYDAAKLWGVSRAFTHFLALSNSAENHHRVRRLRERVLQTEFGLPLKEDSCGGCINRLINVRGVDSEKVYEALTTQSVEIVLTAHPTEVNRRTILAKHRNIKKVLEQQDRPDLTPFDTKELVKQLRREVSAIWKSDELRRRKPTPVEEAASGLAIVESVLWKAVPQFLRKLDDIVRVECGKPLPLTISPIKFASWMGGDRDGNPNVTPEITLEVSMLSRKTAAELLIRDMTSLRAELSLRYGSDELKEYIGESVREPYRHVLDEIIGKLISTIRWTNAHLAKEQPRASDIPLKQTSEIIDPLLLLHRSLIETGNKEIADGQLVDVIRSLAAFGMSLLPLDIRQESGRHTEALDAITRHLGLGSYAQWDEQTRRNWLQSELTSMRPLLPKKGDYEAYGFSPTVIDTLRTFDMAASLDQGSLGAYVISQCQQASDVLAVALLQQEAGLEPAMRVVPLFETLDDLQRSAPTVDALFSMPAYKGRINGSQEIMVGYSDSAKDAGRLAAAWEQYNAQDRMIKVAEEHGVEVTFFHGKGGTVGRGGNPALYKAILAHPPNTINGRFRVTEQGEMITQNFGFEAVAQRTFDLFTAGVLVEKFEKRPLPKPEWTDMMNSLADVSCAAYRKVVREEPRFVPYFRTATPELELAGLNVGSRPAKRNPKGGVESLRAIPWIFAWTQTRLNLPAWLGVGDAFNHALDKNPELIQTMYKEWPYFQTLVDLLEMILVKSEERIAANYDAQLVTEKESLELGSELRANLHSTIDSVLGVSGSSFLQSGNPVLIRSMAVRNPYVDCLNVLQAELLRRLRSNEDLSEAEREQLQEALLITINGIANGMRNSG